MVRGVKNALLAALIVVFGAGAFVSSTASAEGTHHMNELQRLSNSTVIYADILNGGETLNISLCENTFITIYDTMGTPSDLDDDVQVDSTEFTANLDCEAPLPNPITTGVHKFTPENIGTFRIELDSSTDRYDFTVTSNNSQNPNPSANDGRIWSYLWRFSAIDVNSVNEYPEESSTDADLYALVPAPANGEDFVWKLDLNNFAGGSYRLMANNIGLNAPYSGVSASQDDTDVEPMYPIYLGYPAVAGEANSTTPTISAQSFTADNLNKKGTFQFNSNSDNATYAITIDTNKDGIYGTGDRLLLGEAESGLNTIEWDGKYANGQTVTNGTYNARIQLRIGEFHFVARDVEASGGTHDGETWANGLTIYKALNGNTTENTTVYWDDLTALRYTDDNDVPQVYSDATSNLPSGVTSGSLTDANNDGKADGFHTWGDFEGDSLGDGNFIDTFTYGGVDSELLSVNVNWNGDTDEDGVSNEVENGAPNSGDGNNDGTADSQQTDVTSLVNPVTGAYTTIAIDGDCDTLSDVRIVNENSLSQKDGSYNYPVGLIDFDAICTSPGASTNVTVYYDKLYDTSKWEGRKLINGVYGVIPDVTFGTATIGSSDVTTMSYAITDGGDMDEDGLENGTIVDPAGPAIVATAASNLPLAIGAPDTGFQRSTSSMLNVLAIATLAGMVAFGAFCIAKFRSLKNTRK